MKTIRVTPPGFNRPRAIGGAPIETCGLNGGVAYDKFVFELRYPLTMSQASTIFVLGFAEAGNNFHTLQGF
jgi:outer membrane protein insertion porin family